MRWAATGEVAENGKGKNRIRLFTSPSEKIRPINPDDNNLGPTLNHDAAPLMLHVAHQVTLGLIEVPYWLKEVTHGPNHVILEPC